MKIKFWIPAAVTAFLIVFSIIFFTGKSTQTESEGEGEGKEYPSDWALLQRTFPYYNYSPEAVRTAIEQAKILRASTEKSYNLSKRQMTQWEFAGPENIGGRVVDIEFNPQNPNIVYAASATGGILKSTDKGLSWFHIFDDQSTLTIGDLAVDPKNPEVIYAGTGEANGGHNNMPGNGIYKSYDAGRTWKYTGLDSTASIGRIIIDPVNTQNIYAAAVGSYFAPNSQRGIYKSTNGGASWQKSLFISDSTGAIDIIMDPSNPAFLMAAMWERVRRPSSSHLYGPSSGIYRSTNAGASWTIIPPASGLPDADKQLVGRIGLAQCASSPSVIYALYTDGTNITGLYKSINYGSSWTKTDPSGQLNSGTAGFSWYFGQVRVKPSDPNTVYVMDVAFMRSTDGGASWPVLNYGEGYLHVDHHALAFSPDNPNYIIEGNDGGINWSADGGINWSQRASIPVTQFYEIGLDYMNPQRLYGGTQDNNTIRTTSGNTNDWTAILGGDGFYVSVDYTNPNIIYAESQNGGLAKSTDGGSRFSSARTGISTAEPTNWSTPVIIDPNNSSVLYYGTNKIYRSTDKASTWQAVSPVLSASAPGSRVGTVSAIAVAPSNSRIIYAGTDDSNIWVSTDSARTWNKITDGLPLRWVTRIAVDPKQENIVYAAFSGLKWKDPQPHIFRSSDYGHSWTNISSSLPDAPVNAFAVDLHYSNILYSGSDVGAFVSFDTGKSWQTLGTGLPVVSVYDMKIHPVTNYLVIGTHGRSMYRLNLNNLTGISQQNAAVKQFSLSQNYPNPFNPSTRISYSIAEKSHVNLVIYNLQGRETAVLVNEDKEAGNYSIRFDAGGLPSGIYFCSLKAGNQSFTKKMLLLR